MGDFITVAQGLTLNFEPAANFNGSATVVMHAAVDGSGTGLSPAATSTITVDAVNDPPVIVHPSQVDTQEETTVAISGIVLSDIDHARRRLTANASSFARRISSWIDHRIE